MDIKKPVFISIEGKDFLGTLKTDHTLIMGAIEIDEDPIASIKEDFIHYMTATNLETTQDFELGPNTNYITRSFDEEEELIWGDLIGKFRLAEKKVQAHTLNQYFRVILNKG
jgi:hypothetical protein